MRLGVMQPYFFPYLEHFRLMAACDLWVVFDTVGYRRKTWMTRNRVLDANTGWGYIAVSVSPEHGDQPVCEVPVADHVDWRGAVRNRLRVYEGHADHYGETSELVDSILAPPHATLTDVDVAALTGVARALGIDTPIQRLSEMGLQLPPRPGAGEWALYIAEALGAAEYRNPSGGRHLFDPGQFSRRGIELSFHEPAAISYDTAPFEFVPDLSVVDPLMWLGSTEVRRLL